MICIFIGLPGWGANIFFWSLGTLVVTIVLELNPFTCYSDVDYDRYYANKGRGRRRKIKRVKCA